MTVSWLLVLVEGVQNCWGSSRSGGVSGSMSTKSKITGSSAMVFSQLAFLLLSVLQLRSSTLAESRKLLIAAMDVCISSWAAVSAGATTGVMSGFMSGGVVGEMGE